MGGVAVLHPQDVLKQRRKSIQTPTRSHRNYISNPEPNPKNNNRRKRSPQKNNNLSTSPPKTSQLVMGQVKILKRGEPLTNPSAVKDSPDLVLSTTDRIGPEPDMVPKQIGMGIVDRYAGSAFFSSPPPSSLPVPSFFKKAGSAEGNDDATIDLRRLLRLDL